MKRILLKKIRYFREESLKEENNIQKTSNNSSNFKISINHDLFSPYALVMIDQVVALLISWFQWWGNPSGVILYLGVRELHSLYIHT